MGLNYLASHWFSATKQLFIVWGFYCGSCTNEAESSMYTFFFFRCICIIIAGIKSKFLLTKFDISA